MKKWIIAFLMLGLNAKAQDSNYIVYDIHVSGILFSNADLTQFPIDTNTQIGNRPSSDDSYSHPKCSPAYGDNSITNDLARTVFKVSCPYMWSVSIVTVTNTVGYEQNCYYRINFRY